MCCGETNLFGLIVLTVERDFQKTCMLILIYVGDIFCVYETYFLFKLLYMSMI